MIIGWRSLNVSVEFIRFADVIWDSTSNIISTRNICVHPWGKYPTLIGPTCSNYTCRAYVPITCQKGFNQTCDQERLCLIWVKQKIVAFEQRLGRVRQHVSDDVTMNYVFPSSNDALGMGYPPNSPRSSLPNEIEFCDDWVHFGGSIFWLTNSFCQGEILWLVFSKFECLWLALFLLQAFDHI